MLPQLAVAQVAGQGDGNETTQAVHLLRRDVCHSALRALRNGNPDQVLKFLEIPAEQARPIPLVEQDALADAYAGLNRVLSQLDSGVQFDLLHKWSIPGGSSKKVRHLAALVSTVAPPAEFGRALGEKPRIDSFPIPSIGAVKGIYSTAWSLVVAGQKSGKLKRLMIELGRLVEQDVPKADLLLNLARIADGGDLSQVAKQLSDRIAQLRAEPKPAAPGPMTIDPVDVVLAVAALNHRELCPLAEELLVALVVKIHGQSAPAVRPFLRCAHATACLLNHGDANTANVASILAPRLKYWVTVSKDSQELNSPAQKDGSWLVHEDQILHLTGSPNDTLLLRFPLTGDFQFHCEAQLGGQFETDGSLRYGGLHFQGVGSSSEFCVRDASENVVDRRYCPTAQPSDRPTFNRLSIVSTVTSTTISVCRHPMWVNANHAQAVPWLGLASHGESRPIFRNLKVTGRPVIPRSVRMSDGELLRGWQPQAWNRDPTLNQKLESDWSIAKGVIQASRQQSEGQPKSDESLMKPVEQRLLSYERPLLSSETVNYEFFYEPGISEVSPALGRVSFLLQPDGVRIHWITDGQEWTTLTSDNAVVEPLCRRGPRPLPFKIADWNRLSVNRTEQTVAVSLNDVLIYERPIDWEGDHRFGLYREGTTTDVKVRNVELTGDWPQTLPQDFLDNPTATMGEPLTINRRHCFNRLFQEELLAENVSAIRRKAITMTVVDRFEFLSQWVLPGPDHPGFRMTGEFTPTQPVPGTLELGIEHPEVGGQIVSPVFEWLDAAKELGRLPECLSRVETAEAPDDEIQRRARIGLALLLNLELGDQEAATAHCEALYELIRSATAEDQWPEMLFIDRSNHKFAENGAAAKLLADIRTLRAQRSRPSRNSLWQSHTDLLLADANSVKPGEAKLTGESSAALKAWIPVTASTSATRGQGHPVARWRQNNHQALKTASHGEDFLFYRSPLSGNYALDCDLTDMTQIMTVGSYVGARSDRRNLDLGAFRAASPSQPVDPLFSPFGHLVHFRTVIRDGTRTISINGREVKFDKLLENSDPWIAIRCTGRALGGVQNPRITGHPQVLDAVPLSNSRELQGWISYHDEPVCHPTFGWTFVDDPESTGWIVGHSNPALNGMSIEGLLRYQRPLVEDGSIEYDFFYDPDLFETQPALDRLAFILDPSGVREHWVGDGRYDRTDLDPHNLIEVRECRRGPAELPLKVHDWNRLRLRLKGVTAAIELNGQLVYERKLEPTNQRTFGLFHFMGNTSVRVRNAVMRGDWPKTVPTLAHQELTDDATDRLDAELAGLKTIFSHNFQQDGLPDQYFKSPLPHTSLRIVPGPKGVQASQRAIGVHSGFNIVPRFSLSGDFDIEISFTGLRIEGTGDSGIMLNATLDEEFRHDYRALRMKTTPGHQELHCSLSIARPDGGRTYVGDSKSFEADSGRIRLARRGQRIFYLFAEHDSDHFLQFGSEPASAADTAVDGIFLHSFCNGVSISQVTWTKLVLRAERIKWYPPTGAPQEYRSEIQAK